MATRAACWNIDLTVNDTLQILSASGLLVNLVTIEVGCLGHFLPSTVSSLCKSQAA